MLFRSSIVGRFLEHSRIYIFGERDDERIYISSADFMTRNMLRRIEVAVPIYDNKIKGRIWEMFHKLLNDNVNALEMKADGSYEKVVCHGEEVNSQQ